MTHLNQEQPERSVAIIPTFYVYRKDDQSCLGRFMKIMNANGGPTPNKTYVFSLGTKESTTPEGYIIATWFADVYLMPGPSMENGHVAPSHVEKPDSENP